MALISCRNGLRRLALFGLVGFATTAFGQSSRVDQLSNDKILEFYNRAQASGLTEVQIEQAALSQGFTLTDIARMRQRLTQLRLRPGTASRPNSASTTSERFASSGDTLLPTPRQQQGSLSERPDSLRPPLVTNRPVVFGASLFQNTTLRFEPNLRIATPRNYQVGPDDELIIEIYGNSSDNFRLRVDPEGTVRLLNLGPIFVSGLTIEQAERRIVERLRTAYQGLNRPGSGTYANVTLGNIRSIRVTLVGEVVRPGTYSISSLASAFNALYLAGGPNPETGSFRTIKVVRANRVIKTIDLYDFLLRADQSDNIRLQDQDVIRVSEYNARVELTGEVKRPAIYEIKPGETLKTLLGFAGGFTDRAYTASITLRRNTARELRIASLTPEQFAAFLPQAGDQYAIGRILERYENRVQLAGAVMRPGAYALDDIASVRSLIQRADGLRQDAFLGRGFVYRERDNADLEVLPFNVGQILRGEASDIALQRQDSVYILSQRELREAYSVSIRGAVNRADNFPFVDRMCVSDLIALAGGFQEGASPIGIELARRIRQDTAQAAGEDIAQVYRFNLNRNLALSPEDARFVLQPFDIVYVRTSPRYEVQHNVFISGEVNHPGSYALRSRNERIGDLIQRAGGLKNEAFLRGARFYRRSESIATDLRTVLANPGQAGNLLLEDGDSLVIPKQQEIVRIQGGVLNPSTVSYENNFSFSDYIAQAGGYTRNARRSQAYITYANGSKDRTRRILFANRYPHVEPGSTIIVPFETTESSKMSPAERIGMFSLIGTLMATLTTIIINLR